MDGSSQGRYLCNGTLWDVNQGGIRLSGPNHIGLLHWPDRCAPLLPYGYMPIVGDA